jgi:NADH:ubiquinone oxidoreductase subunit F (NADH-binding)
MHPDRRPWKGLGARRVGNTPRVTSRLLPPEPVTTLDAYVEAGGGRGLDAARRLGAQAVVEHLSAAGLRGRGGAGFPTGRKWQAVRDHAAATIPATVVVNAAEGEPGTFKDRALIRANPFLALEGALVAALAVGADGVIVATKQSFAREVAILRAAVDAVLAAGWGGGVELGVFEGPSEYLYGEETGLLEVLDGRPPLPRIAPPYRHGVEEVSLEGEDPPENMDAAAGEAPAPPTLVQNLESLANVPGILAEGPRWYRQVGTDASPGTVICTITGDTQRAGVGEVPMGTPLRQVIEEIGGGARPGHSIRAVMSGVANPLVAGDLLDTPVSFEAMEAIGSGMGSAGFIVFDDSADLAAVAHGVARFLSVESCGQCTPCKRDGLALSGLLDRVRGSDSNDLDLFAIDDHVRRVADSARCFLAHQQQRVLGSISTEFADDLRVHAEGKVDPAPDVLVAPILDLVDGVATLDERQAAKQPDWTYDRTDSGKWPAERLSDQPRHTGAVAPIRVSRADAAGEEDIRPGDRPMRPPSHAEAPDVHGVPVDRLGEQAPDARMYTSGPVETDEGTVVIQQQNVGAENEDGGGEFPDPHTPPQRPAPGAG